MSKRKLENLGFHDFNLLKQTGLLWELYPDAPEFHHEIKKEKKKCSTEK